MKVNAKYFGPDDKGYCYICAMEMTEGRAVHMKNEHNIEEVYLTWDPDNLPLDYWVADVHDVEVDPVADAEGEGFGV